MPTQRLDSKILNHAIGVHNERFVEYGGAVNSAEQWSIHRHEHLFNMIKSLIQLYYNVKIEEETPVNFYYLRERLEKLLVEKRSDKYTIKILPKCGIYNAKITNEYLSMLINQSKITIACSTIADIMMHKYLEIGASKSVIMGNIPHDYKDLLEGRMIGVDYFESDESILEKLDYALSNDEYLEKMSSQLYKEIHEKHNFDCAVNNVNNVLEEICLFYNKKKE